MPASDPRSESAEIAQDARALQRSVLINFTGYAVKLGMPVLLAFATTTYGPARWGVFVTLQAATLIVVRLALLGLDKGMLWWIPSRGPAGYRVVPAAIASALGGALGLALLFGLGGEALLSRARAGGVAAQLAGLRVMLLGVPCYVATEILLNACMGRRRMEPTVVVRETLSPATLITVALILHRLGAVESGMLWAFVISSVIELLAATLFYRRIFRDRAPGERSLRVPRELYHYALPLWLAEIANTSLLRAGVIMIAAFTDPISVGVWGVVTQFSTAMRAIRGAFDAIVTVLSAEGARDKHARRLTETLAYAGQLVTLSQFPVFATLLIFADLVLPLYGEAFGRGTQPLLILCLFSLLSGASGLAGVALSGRGHSRLTLVNVLITLGSQLLLLALLVPRAGLLGAALAVGASYALQSVLQMVQLRIFTGARQFTRRSFLPLLPASAASATAVSVQFVIAGAALNPWLSRSLTLGAFLVVYAGVALWQQARGDLRAPDS